MLESVTQFTENYLNKKSNRLQKAQTFFATKAVQSIPLRHRFVIDFFAILLLLCVGDLLGMALPFLTPHSSLKNYALSTFNKLVVPLIPSGTPAVITTRSPFFR